LAELHFWRFFTNAPGRPGANVKGNQVSADRDGAWIFFGGRESFAEGNFDIVIYQAALL
jgi:hypothetical protein